MGLVVGGGREDMDCNSAHARVGEPYISYLHEPVDNHASPLHV